MILFRRRREQPPLERRRSDPENVERRRVFDQLRAAEVRVEARIIEHKQADAERRAEEVSPRIAYLQALARSYGR